MTETIQIPEHCKEEASGWTKYQAGALSMVLAKETTRPLESVSLGEEAGDPGVRRVKEDPCVHTCTRMYISIQGYTHVHMYIHT